MSEPEPKVLGYESKPAADRKDWWYGLIVFAAGTLLSAVGIGGGVNHWIDADADTGAPCLAVMAATGLFLVWRGALAMRWMRRGQSFRLK